MTPPSLEREGGWGAEFFIALFEHPLLNCQFEERKLCNSSLAKNDLTLQSGFNKLVLK